jgi:tripartite-type tricarboxylate transporter receptor subunit TctC
MTAKWPMLLALLAIGALIDSMSAAPAQNYPARAITLIIPFAPPGGPTDAIARIVGEHMSRTLGQQIVVENVGGAGGTIGSARTMRAAPDGYTVEMGHMGTHAAAVAFYPSLAYKPDVDFEPIGIVVEAPMLVLARIDFRPKDLKAFISYAKTNGQKLNMGHAGIGSISFISCLLLNSVIGLKPTMIPFTSASAALNSLVGGQVDYMCDTSPGVVPQIRGGTIKAYAIGAAERSPVLPEVPTAKEAGLPGFEGSPWFALFAPKGTPGPVLDKLTDALDKALDDGNTRKRLLDLGCDIPSKVRRGQHNLAALVKSEIVRWMPIIKAADVKMD